MRKTNRSKAWDRLARIVAVVAGALALAGCATGYSFVQPDAGGAGNYYTSNGPYQAPAYYYDDTVGAYDPYSVGFGYGSFYGPSFTFGLGLGSVCGWSCGGYYGGWPWYYGGAGYYGRRHHGHHHHHDDPVASSPSPHPWLHPDHPRIPPSRLASDALPPIAVPARPMEGFANRRRLDSASFAPRGNVRMAQPARIPDRPAYAAPQPPGFAERPFGTAAPHDFARPAVQAPAAPRAAPPPAHDNHAPSVKIP